MPAADTTLPPTFNRLACPISPRNRPSRSTRGRPDLAVLLLGVGEGQTACCRPH